jgi:hypothetical protein
MKVSTKTIEKLKQKAVMEATHRKTTNKAPKQTNSSDYPPSPTFIGYDLEARLPLDEATKKATAEPFNPKKGPYGIEKHKDFEIHRFPWLTLKGMTAIKIQHVPTQT